MNKERINEENKTQKMTEKILSKMNSSQYGQILDQSCNT